MERQIYKVFATQVVISESHPEGLMSDINGFPKSFDSCEYKATQENPNGDSSVALIAARAEFWGEVKTLATANNPNRVMWTVKLEHANGREIDRQSYGAFPDLTPAPANNNSLS